MMDAAPLLVQVARLLKKHGLEAILIGNAAAALQGAPVTTADIDFLIRKSAANLKKLKALTADLNATLFRPYYPLSGLYRVSRDADGLQLDFMTEIHGLRSFEGLRKRATVVQLGSERVIVAPLADIIRSKKAAARPQDKVVLSVLERTLEETRDQKGPAGGAEKRK
jgi:hypothetical protein